MSRQEPPSVFPAEIPDHELIHAALHGHPERFDDLMRKHRPVIALLVLRQLRQREDAEDVVQKVFLKAFQHLSDFRGESRFSTWLYTIALNLVRNHVRARQIRRTESMDAPGKTEDSPRPQWPDKSPGPDTIVRGRFELDRVKKSLEGLADPYREIFTQHYFHYRTVKEVAALTGRPLGTVKVYLHRARKMVLLDMENTGGAPRVTS